jgi:hypothetical protein
MPKSAAAPPPTRAPRRRRLADAATQAEGVRVTTLMLPRDLYERSRIAGLPLDRSARRIQPMAGPARDVQIPAETPEPPRKTRVNAGARGFRRDRANDS